MKITITHPRLRALAFTLVEVLIASALSTLTLGSLMMLLFQMAREQKVSLNQGLLQHKAAMLQDFLGRELKQGSRSKGVELAAEVSGRNGFFHKARWAKTVGGTVESLEIEYQPEKKLLVARVGRGEQFETTILEQPAGDVVLRDCAFVPSFQSSGQADNTTIHIHLELDDTGPSIAPATQILSQPLKRTFTVKLRQP